jgi:hypothetical protein
MDQEKQEARKAEKTRRMLEKSLRMPLNEVILQVQDGVIDIKDLFTRIETRVKEGKFNG